MSGKQFMIEIWCLQVDFENLETTHFLASAKVLKLIQIINCTFLIIYIKLEPKSNEEQILSLSFPNYEDRKIYIHLFQRLD